jgi:hypothetical protein
VRISLTAASGRRSRIGVSTRAERSIWVAILKVFFAS